MDIMKKIIGEAMKQAGEFKNLAAKEDKTEATLWLQEHIAATNKEHDKHVKQVKEADARIKARRKAD